MEAYLERSFKDLLDQMEITRLLSRRGNGEAFASRWQVVLSILFYDTFQIFLKLRKEDSFTPG